jgi:hypothetical protein
MGRWKVRSIIAPTDQKAASRKITGMSLDWVDLAIDIPGPKARSII